MCSAIQNQDFTLIDDYVTGLKCLLYMDACDEFRMWNGQSQPTVRHQKGKPVAPKIADIVGKSLPHFGEFKKKREQIVAEHKKQSDLLSEENLPEKVRPAVVPKRDITSIKVSLHYILSHVVFNKTWMEFLI